ncbi:MAG: efflux RND transporter periplasmic adaptor subunit, partial [Firmicutes bacterium]|nr:efflux RND transporter periplasmic adaptor subunit [Bacillota bacterium]
MKKIIWMRALSCLLMLGIVIGAVGCSSASSSTAKVLPVSMLATQNWNDQQQTYGQVQTGAEQNIYLDASAVLDQVLVTEGQKVKIGDPVLTYDSTLLELNLSRQQLSIESQELALELLMKDINKWRAWVPSYVSRIDSGEGTTSPSEGGEGSTPSGEGGEGSTPSGEGGEGSTPSGEGGEGSTPSGE